MVFQKIASLRHRRAIALLSLTALCLLLALVEFRLLWDTGTASLLRPSVGVVFLATLCLGVPGLIHCLLGMVLGYFIAHAHLPPLLDDPIARGLVLLMILLGVSLQAMFQVRLTQEFQRRARRVHPLAGLLVVAPIGSLVGPTVSTFTLWFYDTIENVAPLQLWLVSYGSSVLAVALVYPLAWLLDRMIRHNRGERDASLLLLVGGTVMFVFGVTYAFQLWAITLEDVELRSRLDSAAHALGRQSVEAELLAAALRTGIDEDVSVDDLDRIATELIAHDATLWGLAVARMVAPDEQSAFESALSQATQTPVRVHAAFPEAGVHPVRLQQPQLLIDRVGPRPLAAQLSGLALDGTVARLLTTRRPDGHLPLSEPIAGLTDDRGQALLAWAAPLARAAGGAAPSPSLLLLLQQPQQMLQASVRQIDALPAESTLQLLDVTDDPAGKLVFDGPVDRTASAPGLRATEGRAVYTRQRLELGGRNWEMRLSLPVARAYAFRYDWWTPQVLTQLAGVAVVCMLILMSDRRSAVRELESQFAALSRRYLTSERGALQIDAASRNPAVADGRNAILQRAWESGALQQQYQPVVDTTTGGILGFESLLRWPEASMSISVGEIIDWAERRQLIHRMTLRAVEQAIGLVQTWRQQRGDRAPWISINVSPRDIGDAQFVEALLELFREHPQARRHIKLEITESALVADFKNVGQRLRWLREQGLGIALDDFGTGYSSLSYLHQLPVDSLKIDRSFVANLRSDRRLREIVSLTVELGRRLRLDIVAEGVEDLGMLQYLREIGCTSVQGWCFAPAQPLTVVDRWVRNEHRFAVDPPAAATAQIVA